MKDGIDFDFAALPSLIDPGAEDLLNTIDSIRALNIGIHFDFPQIVVVGDHDSGKSSVLEALTHIRLSTEGGSNCARFVTELVLRRSSVSRIDVNINLAEREEKANEEDEEDEEEEKEEEEEEEEDEGEDREDGEREVEEGEDGKDSEESEGDPGDHHSKPFTKRPFSQSMLSKRIEEAKQKVQRTDKFSRGVLRVEVMGPDVPSLTLVEVPDLREITAENHSKHPEEADGLVESYLRRSNTIALHVCPANVAHSYHGTVVDRLASKLCLTQDRILHIATKPDLKTTCFKPTRNGETAHVSELEWHVLCNMAHRDEEDCCYKNRDAVETSILNRSPWVDIPYEDRGIKCLRKEISKLLLEQIHQALDDAMGNIISQLNERETRLARLGSPRTTAAEARSYLLGVSAEFQRLCRDALNGLYGDKFFSGVDSRSNKLRAQVQDLNWAFGITLSTRGASLRIVNDADPSLGGENGGQGQTLDGAKTSAPSHLKPLLSVYQFPLPKLVTSQSYLNKTLAEYGSINQGRELLIVDMFKKQAQPWKKIAMFHLRLIIDTTHEFIERLLRYINHSNDDTATAIRRAYIDPFFTEQRKSLYHKLMELLRPYAEGYRMSPSLGYYERISGRVDCHILEHFTTSPTEVGESDTSERIQDSPEPESSQSTEPKPGDIIDVMKMYYEMSLQTFSDNIIHLAIESCFLRPIPDLFTPAMVSLMDDTAVLALAGEPEEAGLERRRLKEHADVLRKGLRKCRQYRPRRSVMDLLSGLGHSPSSGTLPKSMQAPSVMPKVQGETTPTIPRTSSSSATGTTAAAPTFKFNASNVYPIADKPSEVNLRVPPPWFRSTNTPEAGQGLE
ncbi:hypothetical protein SAPIO_CDS5683 [Scedosporium apiospermum]|uniref:GED domain-containing protein n=1 Tax=Pseudallescheria apiosperma TaxID=563466 RepID=A0A084G564_PSEDA|nr:uncharacterized protein SAPIO_CDS5683 [Scedosporium apiospermum]KEZ42476.1 hypothetical protein SAPIO_CDS5683 [Scedosporium apiospermum]